jgi:hypothetical protein
MRLLFVDLSIAHFWSSWRDHWTLWKWRIQSHWPQCYFSWPSFSQFAIVGNLFSKISICRVTISKRRFTIVPTPSKWLVWIFLPFDFLIRQNRCLG